MGNLFLSNSATAAEIQTQLNAACSTRNLYAKRFGRLYYYSDARIVFVCFEHFTWVSIVKNIFMRIFIVRFYFFTRIHTICTPTINYNKTTEYTFHGFSEKPKVNFNSYYTSADNPKNSIP